MPRKSEDFVTSTVRFVGEQDGGPERELKKKFCDYFTKRDVRCCAYLAQVEYSPESGINVVLCIGGLSEAGDLAADVGKIFSEMFCTDEHLDVIYLSTQQEANLQTIVKPFFSG